MYSPLLSRPKAFQVRIQGFDLLDAIAAQPLPQVRPFLHTSGMLLLWVSLDQNGGKAGASPKSRNLFSSG